VREERDLLEPDLADKHGSWYIVLSFRDMVVFEEFIFILAATDETKFL